MPDVYTHGHHESVLRSHRWRTAANSAGYLLDSLRPGLSLLDVGCGPGTITVDLARLVSPGRVVGIDASAAVVAQARDQAGGAEAGVDNVAFRVADVYDLDPDLTGFDVVHAHQVLQHLSDPVAALRAMGRALRPGGLLGVRDSDYGAFAWAPADPVLDRWLHVYHQVCTRNRAQADAGRYLLGWVQRAGFVEVRASSSTWTFAEPESRQWWGGLWAERVEKSDFATQAVSYGLCEASELTAMAGAWRRWAEAEDGYFAVVHGEVLARRES
ncbi:MAG: methyltransferase domain-containing protein [Acidimicrobiales bacterium]